VSDAVAAWVQQGYAYGPVEEEDLPPDAKVNGILTRQGAVVSSMQSYQLILIKLIKLVNLI
jgi:hypothetical protein